jgi:quinohemoprotein ethanol dehydrogenase
MIFIRLILRAILIASFFGSAAYAATVVNNKALENEADGKNWATFGRTFYETHYSPLKQITDKNVSKLGLAWANDLPPGFVGGMPLAVDGTLYFATGLSVVRAVDAKTGKELWLFDPLTGEKAGDKMKAVWGVRGMAYWEGKLFIGTFDGRLIAINASTGKQAWSVMTVPKGDVRSISGAPRVYNGKVLIGHGGADVGPIRGYVTCYDAHSGKFLWRFYTVPGDPSKGFENKAMEMAAKTWTGEWWKMGGGGTVWDSMTYDPKFNRVYLGTGNGAPWNRKIRSPGGGDNLFLSSIVALDADTGEYIWHYQDTPGESWDFNSTMGIQLATLDINGKPHDVIMHAPKNGFFYVIDRKDGKLLSAEKFGRVNWAERIDIETGRPVEAPNARFENGGNLQWPGPMGAHNWQPMSYNPNTGLVYIPVISMPMYYSDDPETMKEFKFLLGRNGTGINFKNPEMAKAMAAAFPEMGASLVAWDPVKQQARWTHKLEGLGPVSGSTMTTAGNLVFQGRADGKFVAYAADTGKIVWSFDAQVGVIAPPITYEVDGKQYLSVLAGFGGTPAVAGPLASYGWDYREQKRRLLTFVIGGTHKLPPAPPRYVPTFEDDPSVKVEKAKVIFGKDQYDQRCDKCHGADGIASGHAPELRASPVIWDADSFKEIVQKGMLSGNGMPNFKELDDNQIEALRQYIIHQARETLGPPKTN